MPHPIRPVPPGHSSVWRCEACGKPEVVATDGQAPSVCHQVDLVQMIYIDGTYDPKTNQRITPAPQ